MTSGIYETSLHDAQQLTDDERRRLRNALAANASGEDVASAVLALPPVGAFAAALQLIEPMPSDFIDAMERAIEADLEEIVLRNSV